ncbi:hypothetical protein [Cupriavidus necator]
MPKATTPRIGARTWNAGRVEHCPNSIIAPAKQAMQTVDSIFAEPRKISSNHPTDGLPMAPARPKVAMIAPAAIGEMPSA